MLPRFLRRPILDLIHPCLLALGSVISCNAACAAGIYGYTDEAGVACLSNVPDRDDYRLMLQLPDEARASGNRPGTAPTRGPAVSPYQTEITAAGATFGIEPALLHAVITIESNHNPAARSPKGAMGLMQLMPETSRRFGVADPWHPEQNIRGGARYLSELLTMFDHDVALALAAYNAGEQAVMRHGRRIPPYAETRDYVTRVMALYDRQTGQKSKRESGRTSRAM